jgi:hypothetical protein
MLTRIIEPKRLLLTWQAPQGDSCGGKRYVVAELRRENDKSTDITFHYLPDTEDYKEAITKGFNGYPAFSLDKIEHSHDVLAAFARRIPSRKRGDFLEYLAYWNIAAEAGKAMSDFALMGYTGAGLPNDGFNLIHTYEDATPPCELILEIAGFRQYDAAMHMLEQGVLHQGSAVTFRLEPENMHDSNAVAIYAANDTKIGYVKTKQGIVFERYIGNADINAKIVQINGRKDKPVILVYASITPLA